MWNKMDYRKLTDWQLNQVYHHWKKEEKSGNYFGEEPEKDIKLRVAILRTIQEEVRRRSLHPAADETEDDTDAR